jgi:ribosome biogenesis GTPase
LIPRGACRPAGLRASAARSAFNPGKSSNEMNILSFDRLRPIGFNPAIAQRVVALGVDGAPMRVAEVQRESLLLHDGECEHPARPLPSLLRALADEREALATGDWVVAGTDQHGAWWAQVRVPPLTSLARRHDDGTRQALVSNVDTALLLMGLDGDFNPRRIERYLALVQAAGVWPVVVLTKRDLATDADARCDRLRARLPHAVALHALDARAAAARDALRPYLGAGQTVVLLGSSGAGKSTLTNTLLGASVQATGDVRADDSRGRHTTRARTLLRLAGGACLIDTPGLRGLRLELDAASLGASFGDIAAATAHCRFRDCTHGDEPGCAVRDRVAPDRLKNYRKLQREARRDAMTFLERREQRALWKVRSRAAHARMKAKRGPG